MVVQLQRTQQRPKLAMLVPVHKAPCCQVWSVHSFCSISCSLILDLIADTQGYAQAQTTGSGNATAGSHLTRCLDEL